MSQQTPSYHLRTPGEAYGQHVDAQVHAQDLARVRAALSQALKGDRYALDYRITRRDTGEVRYVRGFGVPIIDLAGNVLAVLGSVQDVTELLSDS